MSICGWDRMSILVAGCGRERKAAERADVVGGDSDTIGAMRHAISHMAEASGQTGRLGIVGHQESIVPIYNSRVQRVREGFQPMPASGKSYPQLVSDVIPGD